MNVRIIAPKTAVETALAEQFGAGASSEREAAFRQFASLGLPTRRVEAWHYTDLRSVWSIAAPLASAPDAAALSAAKAALAGRKRIGAVRLALVDGRFITDLSDAPPPGVIVVNGAGDAPPAIAIAGADALVALNTALAQGGCAVSVAAGVELAGAIEIVHLASPGAAKAVHTRIHLALGAGAKARLVESFAGAEPGHQRTSSTILDLAAGAKAEHVAIVDDDSGLHIESQLARLAENAELSAFALVAGGALVRRQIFVTLTGINTSLKLGGLSLLNAERHADTTLAVEHAAPHGTSREFYKHIVADEATGVYQGKVIVNPGAQKTDGSMKSQAILLSPHAVMNNKPELEIFADDVVCGHGATVGALDPDQTFYLQARGIPKAEAEAMLLEAFGAEAIERFASDELADLLADKMRTWLARRGRA